jgi:hypothetical protein
LLWNHLALKGRFRPVQMGPGPKFLSRKWKEMELIISPFKTWKHFNIPYNFMFFSRSFWTMASGDSIWPFVRLLSSVAQCSTELDPPVRSWCAMHGRRHVGAKPHVLPHRNNTRKQYHIIVTRGWMKTLAIRSDFDFRFLGFRVLI